MAYTLTGQYVHGNGAPRRGRIKFAPSVAIAGDDKVILPSPLTVDLDSGGSFSVPLVGTDDVAYSPSGWVWSCTEVLDGGRTFAFELTADSDIHTLTPVAVPDEYSYLMSDATPRDLGTAAAGTGGAASREDHVHAMPSAADVGAAAADHDHELADITNAGGAAALGVGTTAGTVAAGDDARFVNAQKMLSGSGSPLGSVTPTSAGSLYVDTDRTLGAYVWAAAGATSSDWTVVDGDTGWRNIEGDLTLSSCGITSVAGGIHLRRTGPLVFFRGLGVVVADTTKHDKVYTLPSGFGGSATNNDDNAMIPVMSDAEAGLLGQVGLREGTSVMFWFASTGSYRSWRGIWHTTSPWPTTLPGVAAN